MNLLAIDPGNIQSGYVVVDVDDLKPLEFDKIENYDLYAKSEEIFGKYNIKITAIEMIACYGARVGFEVFNTCVWIGRFIECFKKGEVNLISRKDEKKILCGTTRAKDKDIRRSLIDRFAKFDKKNGKGTKSNPDWFYGFKADVWQAYAVAYTWRALNGGKK